MCPFRLYKCTYVCERVNNLHSNGPYVIHIAVASQNVLYSMHEIAKRRKKKRTPSFQPMNPSLVFCAATSAVAVVALDVFFYVYPSLVRYSV